MAKKKSQKGKSVLKHPDRAIIDKILLTGWSPEKVSNWLTSMKKEPVSEITLRHYRNNFLDPKSILKQSAYAQYIKGLDIHIDTLQELYNLIEIQKRRIGITLTEEIKLKMVTPETREEMKVLRDTIVQSIKLEMELGIREKSAIEIKQFQFDITDLLKQYLIDKKAMEDAIEP